MNKKRKSFSSLVSSLLAISLVLNVSALNVDPGPVSDAETGSVQAELVSEITHMRGANERHFKPPTAPMLRCLTQSRYITLTKTAANG